MKQIAFLLLALSIVNICCGALAGMIDEEKWVKAFIIAAIVLGISGIVVITIALN